MATSQNRGKASEKRPVAKSSGAKRRKADLHAGASKAVIRTFSGAYVVSFMSELTDTGGTILVDRVARGFGMSKTQLAETAGLNHSVVHKPARLKAPKSQNRMREMLEIVGRVMEWAGSKEQGMAWYRAQPVPAFGGRTAESLVKDGKAAAVRDYLDSIALGGFA